MKRVIALFALVAAEVLCASAADAVAPVRIRAANYNIRYAGNESDSKNNWDERKDDFANLVRSIDPDVIGFQEVRSGQYKYLQDEFQGYTFVGEMRDNSSTSEATPVAFRKDRFTLLDSGTFWLSSTPDIPGSKAWGGDIGSSALARICTWTLLKDVVSGGVFCFACTHLDHREEKFRLAGMQLILSRLAKWQDGGVPVVLVGDMNARETESSMLAATEKMQDSLLLSKTKPTGSWRTLNLWKYEDKNEEVSCAEALASYSADERTANAATLGNRIDYIFTTKGVEVESFAIRNDARPGMRYYPSDHYPVAADFVLPCLGEAWLRESAATSKWTGEWSENVNYGEDGRAYLSGDVAFEPTNASTGNVVTVEMKTQFNECVKDTNPDATAQVAIRLGSNGRFQVWTHLRQGYGGQAGWVDVEADGVTPVSGEEYTLRMTFDYTANIYSVEVKTGLTEFTRLREKINPVNPVNPVKTTFPLAASTNCVSSISFVGDTFLSSLYGNCKYEVVGFQPGEISVGDATIILDAAKAAWLNKRGDYDAVKSRLANITSKDFRAAWLCNLDIMNESASAELKITGIKVNADNVEIAVALTRTGAISQAINGSLKFYGAETLAQFKSNATKPIASTTLADEDFSQGDTAIRLFPKDDNVFFKAGIEE